MDILYGEKRCVTIQTQTQLYRFLAVEGAKAIDVPLVVLRLR